MPPSYSSIYDQWDAASSTTASSLAKDSAYTPETGRKSSITRALDKAKSKISGRSSASSSTMDDEDRYQSEREKAQKKQERREEYKKLGLDDRVKFGTTGSGGFNSM